MTVLNVIKNLNKKVKIVNSGAYSVVFESNNSIIKISRITDPCLNYYKLCKSINNLHCPVFSKLYIGNDYYIVFLEKLLPLKDTTLVTLCRDTIEGHHTLEEFVKIAEKYKKAIPNPKELYKLLIQISDRTDLFYAEDVSSSEIVLDLYDSNIMQRENGLIVITDPWRLANVNEDFDLEYWLENNLWHKCAMG